MSKRKKKTKVYYVTKVDKKKRTVTISAKKPKKLKDQTLLDESIKIWNGEDGHYEGAF